MELRSLQTKITTRDQDEDLKIGGYFVVFDEETQLMEGVYEKVSSEALNKTLDNDIRCLFNHDTNLVLGRTSNKTLTLKKDEKGLYGEVLINPNDKQAMDVYERVKRGDIDQCSFGFNIRDESCERENGNLHYTLNDVDLHEVSIVTFPAYEGTSVSARKKDLDAIKLESLNRRKNSLKEKLKGV